MQLALLTHTRPAPMAACMHAGPSSYPLVAATAPSQGLFAGPPAALGPAGISGSTVADTSGLFEPYDLSPPGLSAAEPATTQPTFLPPAPALPPQRTGGAAEILMQDAPPGGVAGAAWPLVAAGGEGQEAAVPVAEWDALHPDVLHLVFKKLNCEDLVSVSGVCTAWRDAAVRVRYTSCPHPARRICICICCFVYAPAAVRMQLPPRAVPRHRVCCMGESRRCGDGVCCIRERSGGDVSRVDAKLRGLVRKSLTQHTGVAGACLHRLPCAPSMHVRVRSCMRSHTHCWRRAPHLSHGSCGRR